MGRGAWKTSQGVAASASRWATGYTQAGPAIAAGVKAPKQSPTQGAIAAQATMLQNITAALTGGSQSVWARALAKAGDQSWSAGMTKYAAEGLASKATKGQPHYLAFAQAFANEVQSFISALPPRGSFAQNQQRSAMMQQQMHDVRGNYRKVWRQ